MNHLNDKAQELKHFMALYDIDLFRGSEANLNWSALPAQMRLSEWFRDVPSCRTFTAHNVTENINRYQFGGTFWIGMGTATQHIIGSSRDLSGLGRWSVCSLISKTGKRLHLIFGYRPCPNSRNRLRSMYAQHRRYFDTIGRTGCPRAHFLADLATYIQELIQQGDEILLMADFNSDSREAEVTNFAVECGLHECILSRHPTILAPATFKCGERYGRAPIDGAWATPGVTISQSMLCSVSHSPGDHRAMILDLNLLETIGEPRF